MATDKTKRDAANVIGGRSASPTLIKIQVVPQIRHKIIHTQIFARRLTSLIETEARVALFQQPPPAKF
ncbi:MAG: hypothetical protein ABJB34_07195, partial [Acidobacteriota bacterium]